MQLIHEHEGCYTLNIEPGEDILAQLKTFAEANTVHAAHISGLGAASEVEIAYYNLETKAYEHTTISENVEVCALNGNIGVKETGETVVHVHGVFGRRNFSTFGGHIVRCVISGAGEIHLTVMTGRINRADDEKTGLTLMCPLGK